MAVAAAAPLLIHSEEEVGDSLILMSPLTGPSLEQRRAPPDGGRPAPTLQLLSAAPAPFAPVVSVPEPPDSLQVLKCFVPWPPESLSLYSLCRSRECLWSSSRPSGVR